MVGELGSDGLGDEFLAFEIGLGDEVLCAAFLAASMAVFKMSFMLAS